MDRTASDSQLLLHFTSEAVVISEVRFIFLRPLLLLLILLQLFLSANGNAKGSSAVVGILISTPCIWRWLRIEEWMEMDRSGSGDITYFDKEWTVVDTRNREVQLFVSTGSQLQKGMRVEVI